MSKLSSLELRSMKDISTSLAIIVKSYSENEDSVQDFICDQFRVETDEPETLKQVKDHYEVMIGHIEDVTREFTLLSEHFMKK